MAPQKQDGDRSAEGAGRAESVEPGRPKARRLPETALYAPVKRFLEGQRFEVKGEVWGCDIVAVRGAEDGEEPGEEMVVVELKMAMNLALVLQGVDRLKLTDLVYLAVPQPRRSQMSRWPETVQLCRRLGLGLLTVSLNARTGSGVHIVAEPEPYRPRRAAPKRRRVLVEFHARSGDHNVGGAGKQPRITAYREEALLVAAELRDRGPLAPREIRRATGCDKARGILSKNYYGWFVRESPGVYAVTAEGVEALDRLGFVLEAARDQRPIGRPDA